jgi:hypothetical protein
MLQGAPPRQAPSAGDVAGLPSARPLAWGWGLQQLKACQRPSRARAGLGGQAPLLLRGDAARPRLLILAEGRPRPASPPLRCRGRGRLAAQLLLWRAGRAAGAGALRRQLAGQRRGGALEHLGGGGGEGKQDMGLAGRRRGWRLAAGLAEAGRRLRAPRTAKARPLRALTCRPPRPAPRLVPAPPGVRERACLRPPAAALTLSVRKARMGERSSVPPSGGMMPRKRFR